MKRLMTHNVMTSATHVLKLLKINLSNKDHHRDYKSIDIGFVANEQLKLALISKIKAKSSLNYSLVRNLQCLVPKIIATKPEDAIANFRRVLQSLVQTQPKKM